MIYWSWKDKSKCSKLSYKSFINIKNEQKDVKSHVINLTNIKEIRTRNIIFYLLNDYIN